MEPSSGCPTCPSPKPAACCSGCLREKWSAKSPNHYVDARISPTAELVIIAEAPVLSQRGDPTRAHFPFTDDSGQIIDKALVNLRAENPLFAKLDISKTYTIRCTSNQGDNEPPKQILDRCKTFLHSGLGQFEGKPKRPILLAMGMSAVKALGIKAKKLTDVQSRLLPGVQIGNQIFDVVVTISTKQLVAVPGLYNNFVMDLRRAVMAATTGELQQATPIEDLVKDYVFPKTPDEVKKVCDEIIAYSRNNISPTEWMISADTETNTKFPHRKTLKVLAVSFSWDEGKSTAIALDHPETPYDYKLVVPYICAVLACAKPKAFHNFKFDFKVFLRMGWEIVNFVWDTMVGEHGLSEDKKGQYGLKPLTRSFFPQFAAYADVVQEMLTKAEGDSQLDNIRKAQKDAAVSEQELIDAAEASDADDKKKKKKSKKKKAQEDGGFEKIPLPDLLRYAAIDTDMGRRLAVLQPDRIRIEQNAVNKVRNHMRGLPYKPFPVPDLCGTQLPVRTMLLKRSFPVTPALARMEFHGIRVDRPYAAKLQNDLGTVILDAQSELFRMGGEALTLNSPQAIANVLFNKGFLHPTTGETVVYPATDDISRTKKGQIQTTEKVMKYLVAKYACPFASKKLIYSKAFKAKNTFLQNVWDLSELDGFLHTNYHQHGTSTGRLSSSDENMQNIPKKLAGVNIKKIFIPTDDSMVFVNADAKGAEVRILTAYCKDQALIDSLNAGQDTHCFIASKIVELVRQSPGAAENLKSMGLDDSYPLTYEDFAARDQIKETNPAYGAMLDKFRTAVKRVVFGILYGAGPKKIAETIGISLSQAQTLIDTLFRMFPSIKVYMEQTRWELRTFGYVETFFGRRRRFNIEGAPKYLLGRAERQTVNFKIQSTSSDIVLGRLAAVEGPLTQDLRGRLLLTVHDSIGFEVPKKYVTQLPDFIYEHLEKGAAINHPWLPVAFKWDYEVGPSYGELSSLNAYLANTPKLELSTDAAEAYTEEEVRTDLSEE